MLDVAYSRAHTCLLDGQLGFVFDSWLWCLLSFVIVFAENLSRKSSTIVQLSSTFSNRFANFANDGSPTTSHLTVVNKNIVWFDVDHGEPYSIKNFKLYYRKNGICNKKKSIPNKDFIMIAYYYDLKKNKSNVSFTENKIQSVNEMHRLRHFYMDASNLSAPTSTTTQRTRCYSNSTKYPEVRPIILNMECKQRSTSFWRPRTTTLSLKCVKQRYMVRIIITDGMLFLLLLPTDQE